jgi:methionyl-tRNA formyltransferase
MKNKKYAFAGNRAFVLQRMRELDLNIVKIWAVRGSYLERYLDQEGLEYTTIGDKNKFLKDMKSTDFDFFISNGLPVILPEEIFGDSKKYVNIHPSLLPDLRGRDPVPGAILYGRDSGATCHLMNKGIDSGDIIAQIEIPHSEDLDAGLLYQLSFMAEADVFESAYDKQFQPVRKQMLRDTDIYYSYQPADMDIDLGKDTAVSIELKVKAFSTGNKGARIYVDDRIFSCSNVVCLQNPYVKEQYAESPWGKILLQYEDQLVVKNIYSELLKFTIKYRGGKLC